MTNEVPRRCRVDLATPAEATIRHAMAQVEDMGADPALTDAVTHLEAALQAVADYVDAAAGVCWRVLNRGSAVVRTKEMTPGQRRVLERLAKGGTARRPRWGTFPWCECYRKGWTQSVWIDDATGAGLSRAEVIARNFDGVHTEDFITDAGRAALESQ